MTERITSAKTYVLVWGVLLVLTLATTGIAFIDLGPWNTFIALAIAAGKAILVALFFMNARFSQGITRVVMVGGLLWLGLLIVGTMDDMITRGWFKIPGG
ncbi:MAG: cytochrome C oxidase subunit IV family protein [Chloroflexi bacterium]|nr:cytochrome C oxidase subunit IV family protein [Chloroflexota bacterium]